MNCRIFMLVYMVDPSIEDMTKASVWRVLQNTNAAVTVAFNGGQTFAFDADDRLTVIAWEERLGLGEAYNRIINATDEPFICIMHNDCFISTGTLEPLIEQAEKTGFAFPRVRQDAEESIARGVQPTSSGIPPSCCYVVTREAWKALGGFDEEFRGCHFEDMDLFLRARMHGYGTPQVEDVEVFHRRGVTRSLTVDESNAAFLANRARYMSKWGSGNIAPIPDVQTEGSPNG